MQQKEVWKPVKGFEEKYLVSNLGGVKDIVANKNVYVLKNQTGHEKVFLTIRGKRKMFYIHRLVYETFVGEIPHGYVVHHKDNNPKNNSVLNLEIMQRGKHTSAHMKGRQHTLGKKRSKNAIESHRKKVSKPVAQMTLQDEVIKIFPSTKEASRQTGVDSGCISRCCNCKLYSAGKYHWKYLSESNNL